MPPGQAGNGQPARMRGEPCCGWNCFGKPGEPFTPHYYVVHGKAGSASAGDIDLAATHERLPSSELAAARLIKRMHADADKPLLHGEQTRRWRQWDGARYAPQNATFGTDLAERFAGEYKILLREIRQSVNLTVRVANPDATADEIEEKAEAEMKAKWGKHLGYRGTLWSERGQAALIRQLGRTCGVDDSLLDADTGEIVVDGGRISVAQILGSYQPAAPGRPEVPPYVKTLDHDPERLVTLRTGAGVDYVPGAACPAFDQFLATSVPDPQQRWWLCWRAISALFGRNPRKGFVNDIGEPDSGKSTFTTVMGLLGGGYARSVEAKTFMVKHASDSGFLADELRGARLVSTHEPEPGARFAVGYMKAVTGRDRQRTRGPYGRGFIEWTPQCTVFIGTNRPVAFDTSDEAVLSRQEPVRFARGYQVMDEHLAQRLSAELPGILNRLLECLLWEARWGLPPLPPSMIAERERLATETEPALRFVEELIGQGRLAEADPRQVSASHCVQLAWLYQAFEQWCHDEGIRPVKRSVFKAVVGRRYPARMSNGCRFHGLMVLGQF
jgi:hypothetical protein